MQLKVQTVLALIRLFVTPSASVLTLYWVSLVMKKPAFYICENKSADQLYHCRETNSVLAIICVHVTGKIESSDWTKIRKISDAVYVSYYEL